MDASQEDALRRRVRELEEELAEYATGDQPGATRAMEIKARKIADCLDRSAESGRLWGGRLIAFLIDHPDKIHPYDALLPQIAVRDMETHTHTKSLHVAVHKARRLLWKRGLSDGIENVYGLGYRMTPACASAIQSILSEREGT